MIKDINLFEIFFLKMKNARPWTTAPFERPVHSLALYPLSNQSYWNFMHNPHCCPAEWKTLENFPSNSKCLSRRLHSWVAGDSLLLHSGNSPQIVSFKKFSTVLIYWLFCKNLKILIRILLQPEQYCHLLSKNYDYLTSNIHYCNIGWFIYCLPTMIDFFG